MMDRLREILRPGSGADDKPPQPESHPVEPESQPVEPESPSRLRTVVNVLIIVFILAVSLRAPVLAGLGRWLVVQDTPAPADLIVVPGGSPAVRALAAADYYHDGLAPEIFVSRGMLERADLLADLEGLDLTDLGNWGLTRSILAAAGVPREAVIMDQAFVDSTLGEAVRVRAYLGEDAESRIVLCTSKYHSRRARLIFTDVLGEKVRIISLPSRYDPYDSDRWWQRRADAKRVVLEYAKLVWFMFEGAPE